MVRKRSVHSIDEYKAYALRYGVKEIILITDKEPDVIHI